MALRPLTGQRLAWHSLNCRSISGLGPSSGLNHRSGPGQLIARRPFSEIAAAKAASKTQVYISRSSDPLVNLSLEHRLLETSHPESTVLLLYANRPCIVFGRNQNPWLEVNLNQLSTPIDVNGKDEHIQLIRRRSGGGTVFHDEGNLNFSVICPPAAFDRDKHAEMVVRALKKLGRPNARVNERHDIVIDVDGDSATAEKRTFKVSGSAYKLTRLRSLHHGTCLLRSPNLARISPLLRSPAEPFIKARGVESVRSPVANLDLGVDHFRDAVVDEFREMYGAPDVSEEFGDEVLQMEDQGAGRVAGSVHKGHKEMSSRDWLYRQTPKFTFSTFPTEEDPRERPALPFDTKLFFEAKHGLIESLNIDGNKVDIAEIATASICDTNDWAATLSAAGVGQAEAVKMGVWLNGVLGTQFTSPS